MVGLVGLMSVRPKPYIRWCLSKLIKPAVEESLQASQGCLFSFPDHKEPHSPIDVEEAYVGLTVHWANSDGDRVDRLVTQSIAIPSLTCLPGQAPPSRELEPTVWSRMRCPPVRNFDTFSPALPVQLKMLSVMWKLNLDLTDEHCSLGGDYHPRTTSAHFPATIVIWKDAAELGVSIMPESGFYSALSLPLQVNLSQFLLASPSN